MKINFKKGVLAATVALLSSGSLAAAEFEFKLHHFLSPKSPAHLKMLTPWAERIEAASSGRVDIEIFPSMTLGGKPPQLPRQVRDGVVDMAWFVNAYAGGTFPRTEVFELPGIHKGDAGAVNQAMFAMKDTSLKKDFKGLVPLFQHVHGGQAFHMVDKEIRTPADLKGLKIRVPSRTGAWVLESLGASPVKTSVGEIPTALAKKVIDGALIPFEIIPPLKIHEQTQYQIEGPNGQRFGNTTFQVSMNKDRWNGLPEDIQQIFRDNSGSDWHAELGEIWETYEAKGLELAVKSGNTHIQLTEDEYQAFVRELDVVPSLWVEQMNAKGIDGQALIDEANKLIKEFSQ